MAAGSCAGETIDWPGMTCAWREAQMRKEAKIGIRTMKGENEFMGDGENVQLPTPNAQCRTLEAVRHVYVHIPFCARICPYCAFYKERADSSQTQRFCEALLREIENIGGQYPLKIETIFFGGGTPTALTTAQLEFLLGGMREHLDLSQLVEW